MGNRVWEYAEGDKFTDNKGNNEYTIVCKDHPQTNKAVVPVKMYAKWTPNKYKVEFNGTKGLGSTNYSFKLDNITYTDKATLSNVTFDTKIGKIPTNFSRTGYDYKGLYVIEGVWPANWDTLNDHWHRKVTADTYYDFNFIRDYDNSDDDAETINNFNGVVKVHTMWYPKEVKIIWNGNKKSTESTAAKINGSDTKFESYMLFDDKFGKDRQGDLIESGTSTYPTKPSNGEILDQEDPSKTYKQGYRLVGWNTKANGTGNDITENSTPSYVAAGYTIYAKWEPVQHNIKFVLNDNAVDDIYGSTEVTNIPRTSTMFVDKKKMIVFVILW